MTSLRLNGMLGLGDGIYQYPVVKELASRHHIYLKTPWPELYGSISNLEFVRPDTRLRTQAKNIAKQKVYASPPIVPERKLSYAAYVKRGVPLYRGLMSSVGCSFKYYLKMREPARPRKETVVVRPVTQRQEWPAHARNPLPEYIQWSISYLEGRGFKTIVVADVHPPHEVYEGARPIGATDYLDKGQLGVGELLDLVYSAKLVIGGVGFIVPMCIAFGTPAVIIHGGAGGQNSPQIIDCPGVGKPTHVLPIRYCRCSNRAHSCDKSISLTDLQKAIDVNL